MGRTLATSMRAEFGTPVVMKKESMLLSLNCSALSA